MLVSRPWVGPVHTQPGADTAWCAEWLERLVIMHVGIRHLGETVTSGQEV